MLKSRLWHTVALAAIFCIALGSFLGCSQDRRYKVLSFFFDGVPAPGGVRAGERTVYQHKPYADGKCGLCHVSDDIDMSIARPTNITQMSSSLCLRCHEKVRTEHLIMHGPVTATECLMCHNPHESSVAHLLKAPAPADLHPVPCPGNDGAASAGTRGQQSRLPELPLRSWRAGTWAASAELPRDNPAWQFAN